MSETTRLFEIQDRLAADADGSARRSLETELATLRQTLKDKIDAGASPDAFRKLTASNTWLLPFHPFSYRCLLAVSLRNASGDAPASILSFSVCRSVASSVSNDRRALPSASAASRS